MEYNTSNHSVRRVVYVSENTTAESEDIKILATAYTTYKIGEALNVAYFPILVPFGVLGNILSFLVMVQPHNRHMSISLYISVLAAADTIALLIGLTEYVNTVYAIDMPPDQYWFCTLTNTILWMTTLCSTLFILSMTFDRFYSIIRPHKAASFNTVKRAKITIACIFLFSILFNIPHLFISIAEGRQCVPFGKGMEKLAGRFYYWLSFIINFALPFVVLLAMNSVIIKTIRGKAKFRQKHDLSMNGGGQSQTKGSKIKKSEMQIFAILLLVTFSFLILTTPTYVGVLYIMFVDYSKSPQAFAGFHLFYNVGHKTYYTNYGINFYLYVMSGQKFRTDFVKLFVKKKREISNENSMHTATAISSIEITD